MPWSKFKLFISGLPPCYNFINVEIGLHKSLRPGWAIFYSCHACSENISFGSLDEITLVVCCCFWHDVEGHWTSWLFVQFRKADPDGRHFRLGSCAEYFPKKSYHVRLRSIILSLPLHLPHKSTSSTWHTFPTSHVHQLHHLHHLKQPLLHRS